MLQEIGLKDQEKKKKVLLLLRVHALTDEVTSICHCVGNQTVIFPTENQSETNEDAPQEAVVSYLLYGSNQFVHARVYV